MSWFDMQRGITYYTAWFQATYYLFTGLWPLVHIPSFMWVTGPKTDLWLVKMVGLLAATIGAALLIHLLSAKKVNIETVTLAILSAISFMAIDVFYATADVISDIYLADAAIQVLIIIGWAVGLKKSDFR